MQVDFIRLLHDYNIALKTDVTGWVNIECPICHHSGTRGYKGGFNLASGYYNCWACGSHSIYKVLKELLSVEYYQVEGILEKYAGNSSVLKKLNKKKASAQKIVLPCDELNERGRKYLLKRNFDPDYLFEKYKVVGIPFTGRYAGRLILPLFYNNRLVSFQARSILSKKKCDELDILRYESLRIEDSVINPKHILYNLDNCRNDFAVVTEGFFDAIRFGDDCCATLGTSTSPEQRVLLAKRFVKLFIIFDPEKEAQERAKKLAKQMAALGVSDVQLIDTELKHDLGAASEKEIKVLKRSLGI